MNGKYFKNWLEKIIIGSMKNNYVFLVLSWVHVKVTGGVKQLVIFLFYNLHFHM